LNPQNLIKSTPDETPFPHSIFAKFGGFANFSFETKNKGIFCIKSLFGWRLRFSL